MNTILFVVSFTGIIYYLVAVISIISGHSMNVPAPIGHIFNVSFSNTYLSTSAIMYQTYFWATYFGILV